MEQTFLLELATVHGAELLFLLNDCGSLVNWQTSESTHGVNLVSSTPQIRTLVTKFSKMVVFLLSDLSKLFSIPLVFLPTL